MCISTGVGKRLFISIKGHLCLTEGHLDKLQEQVETKSPSLEVIFDIIEPNEGRNSKRALFNKVSDLRVPDR